MITINDAEEILKKEYHIDNFLYLVDKILLPDYKSDKHVVAFKNNIFTSVIQLGASTTCDVTVYEVILKSGVEKRRVTITQEMFRILRGQGINNAIVAFANENKNNYRISLLTSKYEFNGDKIIKVVSNPRRYSYTLGYDTKTKTAYKFLIEKGKVNSLEELTARFSVEVVNKQFYSEIATCFTELVGGDRDGRHYQRMLNLQSVTDHNKYAEFAVRLIGRIVFCWFLKEKKSENGIPLLPESMMSLSGITDNYYHTVLEPLFFELLNTNGNRRKGKYLEDEFYKQIPYLNGGLFSPHHDDLYKYDRVNQCGTFGLVTIPDEWFKRFYGVLSQYNFTVDENTSYDIDLSIDPEMLGRIFENLLAEINPETGENLKKSTGSFYTPRDIVDYMVDNSILEYLKSKTDIDELRLKALISYSKEDDDLAVFNNAEKKSIINALYTVTVLDPACGSGAFPIGMLQKIVYILQQVDPEANLWFDKATENVSILIKKEFEKKFNAGSLDYIRKLSVIQNSIFGVDIQPIAVEIARLRCFLSLVIEEKVYDNEPNRGINPLPNLDFKFVIANSLIPLEENKQSYQYSIFENQEHIKMLQEVRELYFRATDIDEKRDLRDEFKDIQQSMLMMTISNYAKAASGKYQRLSEWKPFSNELTNWFDPEWMFGVKSGFDVLIGNPPYGIINKKQNQNTSILVSESDIAYYKTSELYKPCKGRFVNMYSLFIMKALDSLKTDGTLCYIFPMAFMCDLSASNLRKHILKNESIKIIEAFPERDNERKRVFESAKMSVCILLCSKGNEDNKEFNLRIHSDKFVDENNEKVTLSGDLITAIDGDYFTIPLLSNEDKYIINKMLHRSIKMKNISKCYEGEINITSHKKYIETDNRYTRMIRGAQVQQYCITDDISQGQILYLNSNKYMEQNHSEKSKHSENKRIVMQGITGVNEKYRLKMSIIDSGTYCANSVNYLIVSDEKIYSVLALLNSKVLNWFYKKLSTNSNVNGYEVDNLPICLTESFVENITPLVKVALRENVREYTDIRAEIDKLVYKLYGLTDNEIAIVEKSVE